MRGLADTTCETGGEVAPECVESPGQLAVIVCVPAWRAEVENAATPEASVAAVPRGVAPSRKVIVAPATAGARVAVKVAVSP